MPRARYYVDPDVGIDATDSKTMAFAKRLNQSLLEKGWNQSDLARRSEIHLADGRKFGRHLISSYVRGSSMPTPMHLNAMAKALGVTVSDLMPEGEGEIIGAPTTVRLALQSNNRARVRLDMELPTDVALKIAQLVQDASAPAAEPEPAPALPAPKPRKG